MGLMIGCFVGVLCDGFGAEVLAGPWCVQATRVTQLVFRAFEVPVTSAVTRLTVRNAASLAVDGLPAGPVPEGQRPTIGRCGHCEPDELTDDSEWWHGHLVPIVAGRYVVDAAISQMRRPAAGIHTPNVLVCDATPLMRVGLEQCVWHTAGGTVTEITYGRRAPDMSFTRLEGWRADENRLIANTLVDEMRRRLRMGRNAGALLGTA